jgi:hypothetical protein
MAMRVLACESGRRFRVLATESDPWMIARPMCNPFGCLKLCKTENN